MLRTLTNPIGRGEAKYASLEEAIKLVKTGKLLEYFTSSASVLFTSPNLQHRSLLTCYLLVFKKFLPEVQLRTKEWFLNSFGRFCSHEKEVHLLKTAFTIPLVLASTYYPVEGREGKLVSNEEAKKP